MEFAGDKVWLDVQERLLIVSHAHIQEVLDSAQPSQLKESDEFPFPYIEEIRDVLWNELQARL